MGAAGTADATGATAVRPRAGPALAVVASYVALALVAQRALVAVAGSRVYAQEMLGNDCLLHVWTLAWDHHALATQPCTLFDANIFFPHHGTLLYSDHLLGLALLALPLRLFTDDVVLVHNLLTLAAPVLNALALYALAWDVTRRRDAAFVGGLVYGFAPVRFVADRCQLQMLAAWWLPLLLLFGKRALERGRVRDAVAAGVVLALQGASGIYLTAYFLPFLGLAHLGWLRRYPPSGRARAWAMLLGAELVALLALVPPSLAYRAVQAELGTARAVYTNALLALQPATLGQYAPIVTLAALLACAVALRARLPERLRADAWLFVALLVGGLVLALGPVVTIPGDGAVLGPYRALMLVPGYDALRAPGRLVHVALVGASVLAAGAVAALATPPVGRLARAVLLAGTLAALVVEAAPPDLGTFPLPERAESAPIVDWLAHHRDTARVLYVPVDAFGLSSAIYQYMSTWHWAPILNGNMGLTPPVYPFVVSELDRFPGPDVVADLRALGLTHVVARTDRLGPVVGPRLTAALAAPHPPVKRVLAHGDTTLLALRPRAKAAHERPRGRRLDRSRWRATASHSASEAARAIDGSPGSYWRSWSDLDAGLAPWWQPEPLVPRVERFEASLPVRLEIDLGDTVEATAIALRLGGTDPLLAPNVKVEVSLDGRSWQPAPARLRPWPTVRALVRRPREGRYGLAFAGPVRARFVRLSGNGLEMRVADVAVYGG